MSYTAPAGWGIIHYGPTTGNTPDKLPPNIPLPPTPGSKLALYWIAWCNPWNPSPSVPGWPGVSPIWTTALWLAGGEGDPNKVWKNPNPYTYWPVQHWDGGSSPGPPSGATLWLMGMPDWWVDACDIMEQTSPGGIESWFHEHDTHWKQRVRIASGGSQPPPPISWSPLSPGSSPPPSQPWSPLGPGSSSQPWSPISPGKAGQDRGPLIGLDPSTPPAPPNPALALLPVAAAAVLGIGAYKLGKLL